MPVLGLAPDFSCNQITLAIDRGPGWPGAMSYVITFCLYLFVASVVTFFIFAATLLSFAAVTHLVTTIGRRVLGRKNL